MTQILYIIDSSSLIELNKHNPMDVYLGVWQKIEELIQHHRLFAPKEVLYEIEDKDDMVSEWGKKHKQIFIEPNDDQIEIVREILKRFPSLIKNDNTYCADPWIISLAVEMNRRKQSTLYEVKRIVVTEERIRGNRVRIPLVCKEFTVEAIDIIDMFRREGWTF